MRVLVVDALALVLYVVELSGEFYRFQTGMD